MMSIFQLNYTSENVSHAAFLYMQWNNKQWHDDLMEQVTELIMTRSTMMQIRNVFKEIQFLVKQYRQITF